MFAKFCADDVFSRLAGKESPRNVVTLGQFTNLYAGKGVSRSTSRSTSRRRSSESFGGAVASVVIKELKGTTGRRIVRGILGGLFKGR